MEAVGSQVYVVLVPVMAILGVAAFTYKEQIKKYYKKAYVYVFGDDRQRPEVINRGAQFGEGQCSICLNDPKKFQVSATCGHSFCCECIFSLYERIQQRIACPLCRQPITTMFKSFPDNEQPTETRTQMIAKITNYNETYDDNRPLIRTITEFPATLRRIRRLMATPRFWALFIRSFHFFRVIMAILVYVIIPYDIIPERLFGLIGLIDDLLILTFFVMIGLVIFAPIFIRRHGQ